jgi:ATP-binding cassette subfamily F protein 3
MISVNKLSIHFTGEYLFNNVSFIINDRDRIGLVGKNGAGKSTLLKILYGEIDPEQGEIIKTTGQTIGYLPQEMVTDSDKTVFDEALLAFEEALLLKSKILKITDEITHRTDYESDDYLKLLNQLTESTERYNVIGGNTMNAETEKVLLGLGFEKEDFITPLKFFSGGWQMRVELAKILLKRPDTLLLDEPTNHLDIESIQWLENFLINYQGAVVLVSHDRAFLDNVTNRTIEISLGKIFDYKVSYSEYVIQRQERQQQQIAAFNNQQKEIQSIERFIEKFRYKASKARQVQSRIKLLDKMDFVEIDEIDKSSIFFKFPDALHSGKVVLEVKNITKKYDNNLVLNDISFVVNRGERIAFVGKNGEGKTTLSKIIVGELEYEGLLNLGHQVKIGYYAQNQAAMLDPEKTVFQTIDDIAVGEIRPKIRSILGGFLFGGEDVDKKVKVLSGGEKSRLALAKLLLTPVNLLVLDEPTNHLDMQSKDILKNALLQFKGTLIIVSHDRDFLQGLTEKVFEFKNKTIKTYIGDIYDFLEYKNLENLKQLETTEKLNYEDKSEKISENKINWEKRKINEKEIRKIKNKIQKCEDEISRLENEISMMDSIMANPEEFQKNIENNSFFSKYEILKQNLNQQIQLWEELHYELLENEE